MPANTREVNSNVIPSNCSGNSAFDDIIKYFVDSKEESTKIKNENKCKIQQINKYSKKLARKFLNGGPSEETFIMLLHTLKAFTNQITKTKYVLAGRINNNSIELHFSLNRYLGRHHLALDLPTFTYNKRTLLLSLVAKLCKNSNGS